MSYGKSPWIAAFLNFVVWGLGYIYIRHRMVLGAGLLLVAVVNFITLVFMPSEILLPSSELFYVWLSFIWVALSLLFALDVFRETKELNKI